MTEFWVSSGHLLLDRTADGRLALTDDFLRAFLARPELRPPAEACGAERALHAAMLADPRMVVPPHRLAELADLDARANWRVMLDLRDALAAAPTIEDAYLRLVRAGGRPAPLLMGQLVHVILRNALHDAPDPYLARAAELFFRPQRVSAGATVLLADAEAIDRAEAAAPPLLTLLSGSPTLDVLNPDTAPGYWARSDAHDMAFDFGPAGRQALAAALVLWLRHLLRIEATIEPADRIEDPDWRWFVGLDAEATRIGNALWRGEAAAGADRILALFRLTLDPAAPVVAAAAGRPIYLLAAMTADRMLRLKPQNLLTGLPLRED